MTQVMVTSPTSTVLVIVEQASVFVGRETELIAIAGGGGPVFVANRSSLDAIWLRGRLIDSAAPNANDVLTWDAVLGRWVGRAVGIGDISFSDLTGQIANAQVPASAVTQHQATLAIAWGQLAGVPATFPPSFHEHPWSQITATPTTLAGYGITDAALEADLDAHVADLANPHAVDAAQVGAYTIAAVDAIASGLSAGTATVASNLATHVANIANPHAVTKAQVGLALAENVALSTWAGSAAITTIGTLVAGGVPYSLLAGAVPTWNQNTSGNAATATLAAAATVLATPRAINGVNFDGSAPITVTAAAETLTGTALNATVVTSSLTAIGTLVAGTVPTSLLGGALAYAQLPTGGGTWANGGDLTLSGGILVFPAAAGGAFSYGYASLIPVAVPNTASGSLLAPKSQIVLGTTSGISMNAVAYGRFSANTSATGIAFFKSRATEPGSQGIVSSGDRLGHISFIGDDGVDFGTIGARIRVLTNGTPSANRMPSVMQFELASGLADDDLLTTMSLVYGEFELLRATGSATIIPATFRIRSSRSASDWDLTNTWGNLDFWSDDAGGVGIGVRARIGAAMENAVGGVTGLRFSTGSGTLTEKLRINGVGDIGMVSGQKFYPDGVALTGDTWSAETAANVWDFYAGGANTLRLTATAATVTGTLTATGTVTIPTALTGILRADAGVVSVAAGVGNKTLFDHFADANNGTTVETDLYSDTIPAARLAANGEKLFAMYGGTFVGDATSTQRIRVYFGGTLVFDTGALGVGVTTAKWGVVVDVIRVSSSVVRVSTRLTSSTATLNAYADEVEVTGLTLANTQIVKITGTAAGVTGGSNQITAKQGYVQWLPAA